jgi:hypothetical protein
MDKWDYRKFKSICTAKEMVSNHPQSRRNICQLYIRQRTDNQNIQVGSKLNSPKINEFIKK